MRQGTTERQALSLTAATRRLARRVVTTAMLVAAVGACGSSARGRVEEPSPAALPITSTTAAVAPAPAAPAATSATAAAPSSPTVPAAAVAPDDSPLDAYVRTHAGELRTCYEQAGLKVDPALAGEVTLSLDLAADGRVTRAGVEGDWAGEGGRAVETCIAERARGWRFPAEYAAGGPHAFDFRFSR